MIRWSLYGLVYDRQKVTEEMVEETSRLLNDPRAGQAWSSFQKNEVGWGGLTTDFSDRLSTLTMPTLLVHGRHDRAVPLAWARRAQERIPDCELRVFSECGHLPPREHSEEFAGVVGQEVSSRDASMFVKAPKPPDFPVAAKNSGSCRPHGRCTS